ncbi:MAG: hypothetical protein EXS14_08420 [Planctomycetes bacterium]|nr:hypothetical protein [Planctomycetota bacterium]
MMCQMCQNSEATVLVKQIIAGHKDEIHLCAPCAAERGLAIAPALILQHSSTPVASETPTKKRRRRASAPQSCKSCGSTLAMLKETGRLGCPEDYVIFEKEILNLLLRAQGCTEHRGRQPARMAARQAHERRVASMRTDLSQAIAQQDYERAATLRDMLHCLEAGEQGHA